MRPDESVSETIARFSPSSVDEDLWARIGPTVRQWAEKAAPDTPYSARTLMSVLTQLVVWGDRIGLGLDAEALLHPDVIDRFVTEGLPGYSNGTSLNYRRHLRLIDTAVLGSRWYPPKPLPLVRDNVLAPYSTSEVTLLLSWARSLPTERFRHTAEGMIDLGLGAGLPSQEHSRLVGTDVTVDSCGVVIDVIGKNARLVPVLADWEDAVTQLGELAGSGPVLMPGRTRITRHQLKNFLARCPSGDAQILDTGRLRATWICRQLAAGTHMGALEAASGVNASQLVKYLAHIPDLDPSEARRQLREASPGP